MVKWVEKKAKSKLNNHEDAIEKIAKIRGIKEIDRFLRPTEEELHDPYLMHNIETASNRIIRAIHANEKIVLSYDPDADGLTSTSIMYRYLKNYTDNVEFIYGERNDGHGVTEQIEIKSIQGETENEEKIQRYERNMDNRKKVSNADLLILIDSSSNEAETCRKLANLGIEIIILDHHAIERENPHVTLVNPQQELCQYPNKHLSGAGVVFKTIQVMEDTLDQVDVWQYIDLVAVGMYADMMRIDVPENRYLILHGLRNLKNTGLIRILKGGKVDTYKLKGDAIGFTIAPLLNGVARMGQLRLAIDILLEDDDTICKKLRLKMAKLNEERKLKQKEILKQYEKNINANKKVLIVMDEQSSKGFNGVVAQQLSERYQRPVIVGRIHEGVVSGSFRSYNNFKFKKFLQGFEGEIEALGHEGAGGIIINQEYLANLETYIERNMPALEETEVVMSYDFEIGTDDIQEYVSALGQWNLLTGIGFPKIIVRVNGITVEEAECIGKTRETVKIKTFNDMELIRFRVNENYASELSYFDEIDVVGELSLNEFYNFALKKKIVTPQVIINDYKVK